MARTILFIDRFVDPDLAEWTKSVGGSNSISQVSEQKSTGMITYTETRVDFSCQDTGAECRMWRKIGDGSKSAVSVALDILLPSRPSTSGNIHEFFALATWTVDHLSGVLVFLINDAGKIEIYYSNTGGSSASVTSNNAYDGQRIRIAVYADVSENYAKVFIGNSEVIEITDFAINTGTGLFEYVSLGAKTIYESFTFSVYSIAVSDYVPSPIYTINGYGKAFSLGIAWSRTLGVYAVPYADPSGNCYVQIRKVADDSLVTTIDLQETIDPSDIAHEYVDAKFINENGTIYLYAFVGRHNAEGTLIKIGPSNWSILWKKTLSTGTYGRIVVYKGYVAVVQREGIASSRPLYMHVYDVNGNLVQSIKIVDAGSNIWIYPELGVDDSSDGRYLAIGWTYYDEGSYTRNNVYMLIYDAQQDKWFAWNGAEKTLPVQYNDADCLVSDQHSDIAVHWRNGKLYVALGAGYDPVYIKVLEYDPSTFTSSTIYDGTNDNLTTALEIYMLYDPSGGLILGLSVDFDNSVEPQRLCVLWNYYVQPGYYARLLDLENKILVFQNTVDTIEVYEISYTSTDSPNAETSIYQYSLFKITNYPSSVSGAPNESKTISITVENQGNADGDCTVRIKDHNGNAVAEQTKTITAGSSATFSLNITLPSTTGTYTWTIEAYNVTNDTVDDTKSFTVNVVQQVPLFAITSYPSTVSGTPSETKTINITVENLGNAGGDCTVRIKDHNGNVVASDTKTISAGGSATYSLSIALPSETGTYTWTIEAYNVSTDRVDDTVTFTVEVEELRPEFKITNYPSTVSGSPSSSKTVNITVENQGNVEGTVEARIKDHNGNIVASQQQTISAGQSYTFSLQITLPSNTGTYTWTIEAYNVDTNAVDDTKTFTVEVTAPTKKKTEFPWWILLLLLGMGYVSSRGYREEEYREHEE